MRRTCSTFKTQRHGLLDDYPGDYKLSCLITKLHLHLQLLQKHNQYFAKLDEVGAKIVFGCFQPTESQQMQYTCVTNRFFCISKKLVKTLRYAGIKSVLTIRVCAKAGLFQSKVTMEISVDNNIEESQLRFYCLAAHQTSHQASCQRYTNIGTN